VSIHPDVKLTDWLPYPRGVVVELDQLFPGFSWGTYPGHDPHENRAADAMVPNWSTAAGNRKGWELARWIWENRYRYNAWYVIFDGKIISQTDPGKGWAPYFARNDPNPSKSHKNHVHFGVYQPVPFVTVWLDRLQPGVKDSESVRAIERALGLSPTGNYDDRLTAAVRDFQEHVLQDAPQYVTGTPGKLQTAALLRTGKLRAVLRVDDSGQAPPVEPDPPKIEEPPLSGYPVRAGDTLSAIASRFGYKDWRELAALNPDIDPDRLAVGQLIRVDRPEPDEPAPQPPPPVTKPEPFLIGTWNVQVDNSAANMRAGFKELVDAGVCAWGANELSNDTRQKELTAYAKTLGWKATSRNSAVTTFWDPDVLELQRQTYKLVQDSGTPWEAGTGGADTIYKIVMVTEFERRSDGELLVVLNNHFVPGTHKDGVLNKPRPPKGGTSRMTVLVKQISALQQLLGQYRGKRLVAITGDLNLPWGTPAGDYLERKMDAAQATCCWDEAPDQDTHKNGPIDYVIASDDGVIVSVKRLGRHGSDHYALLCGIQPKGKP